jgi:hypothetical protein
MACDLVILTRFYASRQVKDALAIRNGPDVLSMLSLPIQSNVRIWWEKDGWMGLFKLLSTNDQTYIV